MASVRLIDLTVTPWFPLLLLPACPLFWAAGACVPDDQDAEFGVIILRSISGRRPRLILVIKTEAVSSTGQQVGGVYRLYYIVLLC